MNKHKGKREREARKRRRRGTVSTSRSGYLTFKLGRKKMLEFGLFTRLETNWKKFTGCVVDTER